MLEARITYANGRKYVVEANTIDILKSKCKPFIDNPEVIDIWIVKIEGVGWLKSKLAPQLL